MTSSPSKQAIYKNISKYINKFDLSRTSTRISNNYFLVEDKEEKKNKVRENCSICMSELSHSLKLDCGHKFHKECIKSWFKFNKSNCPNCRVDYSDNIYQEGKMEAIKEDFENLINI
mmetsp:Transcript_67847/g.146297  ORF Transcript_67847/g.146297 Transcript_67847/m.146297 type:complete len:117 (+) Transcript_67847:605-955(+)